ncbi:hypothetical protein Tco_1203556 [Tanacetum coccineum]
MFIKSRIYLDDEYVVMTRNYFLQYTQLEIPEFRNTVIQHMESVKKSIDERALHKREYDTRKIMVNIIKKADTKKPQTREMIHDADEAVFILINGEPWLYGGGGIPFQLKSDSLPHAHAQTTKTYYKHQDSRIKKAQDLKTKTSANSDIQDLPSRYQVYQGRLLASFQDDAKYEHVGQDTRSQGGKDDQDKRIKI